MTADPAAGQSDGAAAVLPEAARSALLAVHRDVAAAPRSADAAQVLVDRVAAILGTGAAVLCRADGAWTTLAEAGGRAAAAPWPSAAPLDGLHAGDIRLWDEARLPWTLVGLGPQARRPFILAVEGDWTSSSPALRETAERLLLVERMLLLAARAGTAAAVQRLTRALQGVDGLPGVCGAVLQHLVRAVPGRLAAFAVPDADDTLRIVATQGYPLDLVAGLRIEPGRGVIGHVYRQRAPLCVRDVRALGGTRPSRARYRTRSFVALPVSAAGAVLGVVCMTDRIDERPFTHADVSVLRALVAPAALALAREQARRQVEVFALAAVVDPVSGLFNRRHFQDRLEEELLRARREKARVGLLMLDIDDFKQVNDRYGHAVGDQVLAGVAEVLRGSVRRFDTCARVGGEEFAVVMPGVEAGTAGSVAERIRRRIEALRLGQPALAAVTVTASIGLAVSDHVPGRQLIERADQALYRAKRTGKNRVVDAGA